MSKMVSTKALVAALLRMGFTELKADYKGSHRVFEHRCSGLKVTVPHAGEPIRPIHLSAIRRQVSNFEIASDEEFDRQVSGHASS